MKNFWNWLALFGSSGTLLCCALPSLLVSLGMGASLAGLLSSVPQLVEISRHKSLIFLISAVALALAFYAQNRATKLICPTDPQLAATCQNSRTWGRGVLYISLTIWLIGAFFAFLAPVLLG